MASRYDWRRLLSTVVVPVRTVYGIQITVVLTTVATVMYRAQYSGITPGLSGLRAAIRTGARRLRGPLYIHYY